MNLDLMLCIGGMTFLLIIVMIRIIVTDEEYLK